MEEAEQKAPLSVTLIIYCLGMAAMLPWNFFITADSFWQYKLRDVSLGDNWDSENATYTSLQISFMPTLSIISNVFCFLFLFFTSWIVMKVSEKLRVTLSLVVMTLVMTTITALAVIDTDAWQTAFYVTVMVMVAVLNMFEAVYQGSLYGITGQLPSNCTNAVVSGMAIAGVLSSVAQIISLLIGKEDPIRSGIIYFIIADAFLIMSLIFYLSMRKMVFYKTATAVSKKKDRVTDTINSTKTASAYWTVFKKIWLVSLSPAVGLLLTLCIYPATQVYVTSTTAPGPWRDVYFQPTITFLLFNIGDVIGRELPRWIRWPSARGGQLLAACSSRVVLVLLIMLCYGQDKTFPTVFYNDAFYIVFNALFGITNGYFGCLSFIYYPDLVEPEEVELAGTIMGAVMGAGMVLGSLVSPGFVALWGPLDES